MAERVGFEPTWRLTPPIRFRVGAVMATSVPLLRLKRPDYMPDASKTPEKITSPGELGLFPGWHWDNPCSKQDTLHECSMMKVPAVFAMAGYYVL